MDDRQLKKILDDSVPPVDENARKTALNLALAEFSTAQSEQRNKITQGSSLWSRLTGRPNTTRRESMNKRYIYGGMATAMVVVLAATATMNQYTKNDIATSGVPVATISDLGATQLAQTTPEPLLEMSALKNPAKPEMADREVTMNEGIRVEEMTVAQAETPAGPAKAPYIEYKKDEKVKAEPEAESDLSMRRAVESSPPSGNVASAGVAMSNAMPLVAPADQPMPQAYHDVGRDNFKDFDENVTKQVKAEPVSTFSIDVDSASYAFVRNQLNAGVLPQKDAVRVEEMINYFDYNYPLPEDKAQPFKSTVNVMESPWHEGRKLIHIGIKGYDIAKAQAPNSNLVFLLDTSGSMEEPDKLPLLVSSLKMMLDNMKPDDKVAIVVYAGSAGTVLEPTKVSDKAKIIAALDNLSAGGGTAGAEGIRQAYALAEANFNKGAVNRVILATDGDFNVGISNEEELKDFVERKRETGIFLSVLGFGQGNYNDSMMQTLAQNGNGTAAYIDTLNEARKVLVEEASSTLFTIAKDVKIQVEFNPETVSEYRLVGYETRKLNQEDFNNDKVDAGDIGAGHTVTAIYEITPVGAAPTIDPSRYADAPTSVKLGKDVGNEYAFLKIRYKLPEEDTSKLITTPITTADEHLTDSNKCQKAKCLAEDMWNVSDDVRFSVAVASFGQLLKGGKNTGNVTYDDVISEAQRAKGADEFGYRAEFINLVRLAKSVPALPDTQP